MLANYDRAYAERDKTESGSYVQEYVNHFLQGEPTPGIEYEQKLVQALVPTITAVDVATAAKAMFADTSRVILAVSPQKAGVTVPTDAQLTAAISSADAVAVTPWADTSSSARAARPRAGSGLGRRTARDPRARRHRRPVVERRRGLAQADRLQERPGPVRPDGVRRQLARGAGEVHRGAAGHRASRVVRRRWPSRDRPAEADGGKDRVGLALHLALVPRHPGVEHARQYRDGTPAAQHQVHRAGRRRGGLRPHQAPARIGGGQPPQQPQRGVRRQAGAGPDDGPLHLTSADGRTHRRPRPRGDGVVLSGAVLQTRPISASSWWARLPWRTCCRC